MRTVDCLPDYLRNDLTTGRKRRHPLHSQMSACALLILLPLLIPQPPLLPTSPLNPQLLPISMLTIIPFIRALITLPTRSECRAHMSAKDVRLFGGREVPARGGFGVPCEVGGVGARGVACPAERAVDYFVGEAGVCERGEGWKGQRRGVVVGVVVLGCAAAPRVYSQPKGTSMRYVESSM